jgi:hypothetical protein
MHAVGQDDVHDFDSRVVDDPVECLVVIQVIAANAVLIGHLLGLGAVAADQRGRPGERAPAEGGEDLAEGQFTEPDDGESEPLLRVDGSGRRTRLRLGPGLHRRDLDRRGGVSRPLGRCSIRRQRGNRTGRKELAAAGPSAHVCDHAHFLFKPIGPGRMAGL